MLGRQKQENKKWGRGKAAKALMATYWEQMIYPTVRKEVWKL